MDNVHWLRNHVITPDTKLRIVAIVVEVAGRELVTPNWLVVVVVVVIETVRRDVQENDEEAVRVKEQSILELGTLLAKTGQAAGKRVHL